MLAVIVRKETGKLVFDDDPPDSLDFDIQEVEGWTLVLLYLTIRVEADYNGSTLPFIVEDGYVNNIYIWSKNYTVYSITSLPGRSRVLLRDLGDAKISSIVVEKFWYMAFEVDMARDGSKARINLNTPPLFPSDNLSYTVNLYWRGSYALNFLRLPDEEEAVRGSIF